MVIDLSGYVMSRDKVFPGAVVALKGIVRGKVLSALVLKIHPADVEMTDPSGELVAWNGRMPVIDVIAVDRKVVLANEPGAVEVGNGAWFSETEGEPIHIEKIPWAGDIERRASWKGLPHMITEMAPRYIVIGEMHGA